MSDEDRGHVTTELTSKKLKAHVLMSWVGIFIGVMFLAAEAEAIGTIILLGSIVWKIVTRIRIWWNHG